MDTRRKIGIAVLGRQKPIHQDLGEGIPWATPARWATSTRCSATAGPVGGDDTADGVQLAQRLVGGSLDTFYGGQEQGFG